MKIVFEKDPSKDIKILIEGINQEAEEKKNQKPTEYFGFFIENEKKEKLGGITGLIIFGWIVIPVMIRRLCLLCRGHVRCDTLFI